MALRAGELDPGTVDLDRDRLLVMRYQGGDQSAFDELYRRYFPRLHLYCSRRVRDAHVSEELAQEAFLRALQAMPRFAGERRFYPWMTVIAQRLCIDHHRRTARVEPAAEIDLGAFEEHHHELFAEVDREHLSDAMQRLAPRYREVLSLREERGWSYQQIADHLDVPLTTVEALLHRARKALKREFLAVSSGSRLASLPVVGAIVVHVAHVRARFSGRTLDQLAPVAGPAAAGIAAVSLALSPFVPSSAPALTHVSAAASRPPAVSVLHTPATPVADTSAPPVTSTRTGPRNAREGTGSPSPLVQAGPVSIASGTEATTQAQRDNDQQPVHVDLQVIDVGLNPQQTVADALDNVPGGTP